MLKRTPTVGDFVFSLTGTKPFQSFSAAKRELDKLSEVPGWRLHDLRRTCVSGMARLGVAPHVADKVLNHQTGTISALPPCISVMSFWQSAKTPWTAGVPIWLFC